MPSAREYLGDTSRTQDMVLLGVLALGVYIVYELVRGTKAAAGALGAAGAAVYHGAQTITAPVATALAAAWNAMTLSPSMSANLQGNVIFPDGSKVPIGQLTVKQDTLGNVYVAAPANGLLLQLQPSNAQGDWPAVQITDPSQIGQAPGSPNSAISQSELGGATPGGW